MINKYKINLLIMCILFQIFVCICIILVKKNDEKDIMLSEICSNNLSVLADCEGNYSDYIELYNPTSDAFNLKGYMLSDKKDFDNEKTFLFENVSIPAKSYLVVFADGSDKERTCSEIHINFKISSEGEEIYLKNPNGKIVDAVAMPKLRYNTSYTKADNTWYVMSCTPQKDGGEKVINVTLASPRFSLESGNYDEGEMLELQSTLGTKIYYTIDGSEPDTSSFEYTKPIIISNISNNKNKYSIIKDVSLAYEMDNRYSLVDYKVDKCLVIRARAFDNNGNGSEIVSKTYFCDIFAKDLYANISVISLVTNPENLFGYERGIYVKGKTFDDWLVENRKEYTENGNWWHFPSNFHNRGIEWEREASIELFDENKKFQLSKNIGIRIKGGGSRGQIQKSFNLFSRKEYDENEGFPLMLWEDNQYPKNLTLFSGGDDLDTKIKDVLIAELCKDRSFSTLKSIPSFLFINGEYWGLYHLQEKYDSNYIETKYGVTKENIVMIKNMEIEEGKDEDIVLYDELMNYANENDLSDDVVYKRFCDIIDIQSFIDYYAAEIYIARNNDWPRANEAFWRARVKNDDQYGDGKWRWMLFDVNSGGLSFSQSEENTFDHVMKESVIFRGLFDNVEFCEQFIISFMDMYNTIFQTSYVIEKIRNLENILEEPVVDYYKRFYGIELGSEYFLEKSEDLKKFFINRPQYILNYLIETFGIKGNLVDVTIEGKHTEGDITLNTINLDLTDSKFVGKYFTDFPIELRAIPSKGYEFVQWNILEEDGDVVIFKDEEIKVNFKKNLRITPIFEKK